MTPNLAVGIDEGLLIDASDALESADIEGILGAAVAWALSFEFTPGEGGKGSACVAGGKPPEGEGVS
jgi:hypothetical protein